MERPGKPDGDGLFDLSNYGTAEMDNASAQRENGQWIPYDVDLNEQFTMTNGSAVLSTVTTEISDGQPAMRFTWHNFQ